MDWPRTTVNPISTHAVIAMGLSTRRDFWNCMIRELWPLRNEDPEWRSRLRSAIHYARKHDLD